MNNCLCNKNHGVGMNVNGNCIDKYAKNIVNGSMSNGYEKDYLLDANAVIDKIKKYIPTQLYWIFVDEANGNKCCDYIPDVDIDNIINGETPTQENDPDCGCDNIEKEYIENIK